MSARKAGREVGKLARVLTETCEAEGLTTMAPLTVLSDAVDPYRQDKPRNHAEGAWFAEQLFLTFGDDKKTRIRGMHYAIMVRGIKKPNGEIYSNTPENWEWLMQIAKAARWSGQVALGRSWRSGRDALPDPPRP